MGKKEAKDAADGAVIAPTKVTPPLDTSSWPLLLKNYSTLNVRTGHYTPIPSGSTPLARPIQGELCGGERGGKEEKGRCIKEKTLNFFF